MSRKAQASSLVLDAAVRLAAILDACIADYKLIKDLYLPVCV